MISVCILIVQLVSIVNSGNNQSMQIKVLNQSKLPVHRIVYLK